MTPEIPSHRVTFMTLVLFCLLAAGGCDNSDSVDRDETMTGDQDMDIAMTDESNRDPDQGDLDESDMEPQSDTGAEVDMEPELDMEPIPLPDLSLNSLVPNRGPISGGNTVTIVGTGFSPNAIFAFDRVRCANLEIINSSRARCQVPEGFEAASVSVTAYDERMVEGMIEPQQVILDEAYTYFVPLTVDQIIPERGPSQSNTRVTVVGEGFTEGTTVVSFGGVRALSVEVLPNGTLSAVAPPGDVGRVDVTVLNENGQVRLEEGFYYYERLEILGLSPAVGPLDGGVEVLMSGRGLREDSRVTFGGRAAQVLSGDGSQTLRVSAPRGAGIGSVDVEVTNENGDDTLESGFVYYDAEVNDFTVSGIAPQSGPIQGGGTLFIAGSGFEEGIQVDIGGRAASCQRVSAYQLSCSTPPGTPGLADVEVIQGGQQILSPTPYTYYQEIALTAVFPSRGSIAGGTLIELSGRGFQAGMEVFLGEQALEGLVIIDELNARGVTPSSEVGTVDIIARTPLTRGIIEAGFEYFDPTSQFGGVWGDQLVNSMNITVINGGSGAPEPEVQILLITDELLTLEGVTNVEGRVTLSHPNLRGPANITAAKEGFEVTTLEDVEVENTTIILTPQPEGDGAPPPGVPPATLQGTVRGLDLIPKPSTERFVNIAVVETTHTTPSNRQELPPPGPGGLLLEDGPFNIISRLGELAVVVTVGRIERVTLTSYQNEEIDYWTMRDAMTPLSMGVRRYVSARSGETTSGLHVEVDHPLDLETPIDFDNPPYEPGPGPSYYAILPRLNFGAEGFWELDTQAFELDPNLTLRQIPRLDDWGSDVQYFLINFAFTPSANNTPMSINIAEFSDLTQGALITPFAPAAIFVDPLPEGTLNTERTLSWRLTDGYDGPMVAPSATVIEVAEPSLGGPVPLWRYVVPPGVTEVEFPVLSAAAGETGLNGGFMLLNILPFLAEGRFEYDDFTYLDINGSRWESYGISSTSFVE